MGTVIVCMPLFKRDDDFERNRRYLWVLKKNYFVFFINLKPA